MATALSTTHPSWLDVASRMDPGGQIDAIVEIMNDYSPLIGDAVVMEGNLTTGHRSTQRTGLPSVAWRLLNQGVPQSKSTTQQVTDTAGMLEGYSEIDKKLAHLNSNSAAFMASEDMSFLESMTQTMEQTTFAGNTATNPERFLGLAARYSTLATTDRRAASYNVIDNTGTTSSGSDQASIYLVTWGPNSCFQFFPKGSMAGFNREYLGQQTLFDASSRPYEGYRTHYSWDLGLVLRDWRSCGRVCNIDTADLDSTDQIAPDMIRLLHRVRGASGRRVWYCGETVYTHLDLQARTVAGNQLTLQTWEGKEVLTFRGIPIRQTDALTDGEAIVS